MNNKDYKNYWKGFENNPEGDYAVPDIEEMIGVQSKETSDGLQRYLKFDLLLKAVTVLGLIWVVYLFRESSSLFSLSLSALLGGLAAIRQAVLIKHLDFSIDLSLPVKEVVGAVFKQIRSNLSIAAILVGITNPLIILTGSFLYYSNKYGPSHTQDTQDALVTILLMLIGFAIGYAVFSIQQNSQFNDLELSLETLKSASDKPMALIAKRRKRRTIITIVLVLLGLALFFIFLIMYLFLT